MDGDVLGNLDDILNSIYLSTSLSPEHINSLKRYLVLCDGRLNETFEFLLSLFTSRTNSQFKKELLKILIDLSKEKPQLSETLFKQLFIFTNRLKDVIATKTISETIHYYSELYKTFNWDDLNVESKKSLLEAHCIICFFYAKLRNRFLYEKNYKCLKKQWQQLSPTSLEDYLNLFKETNSNSSNINISVFWDNLIRFLAETNNVKLFEPFKASVIDLFVKNVIMSKQKLSEQFDPFCFQNTMCQLNEDEFKTTLFPSIQKAILRNPEISLSLICLIIEYLNFDLSDNLEDICKILGGHLHSKNENLQEESLIAVKVCVEKCSKNSSLESAVNYFAKIYHGSEGKLTVLGQRQTVIKSIGHLSYNKADLKQSLLNIALEELFKMFKQETAESSLILIFSQIKLWIKNCPKSTMPDEFWKFCKDCFKSKSITPTLLASLYECLISLLTNNNENEFNSTLMSKMDDSILIPILNSSKNVSAALTKIQVLIESLNASLLLLMLYSFNKNHFELKLKNFLQSMQNLSSITFLTDKFIQQSPLENLFYLINFIYCLRHNLKLNDENLSIINKNCIFLMTHPSRNVCDKAIESFRVYCSENPKFPLELLRTFNEIFQEFENENQDRELNSIQNDKYKLHCCQAILNESNKILNPTTLNDNQFILEVLQICHYPFVFNINSKLFSYFLHKNLDEKSIEELLEKKMKTLTKFTFESKFGKKTTLNIVKTLIKLHPHLFVGNFVHKIFDNLENHLVEYKSITKNDYEIYQTPDDQLYNRAAVIEAGEMQVDKNLKRESKLYSHKEQLAEIQLRKELEAKNKKDELDLKKLSKKQKDIYNQEMENEKNIRKRLKVLYEEFVWNTNILLAIMESNAIVASIHFKDIIFIYVDLFSSILVFHPAIDFYKNISRKMMICKLTKVDSIYLSHVDMISNATINLYKLNQSQPEAIDLLERIIDYVYKRTCPDLDNYNEKLIKQANNNRLTAPAFSFVFPLLRYILLNDEHLTKENNDQYYELVKKCSQIITQHSLLRCYAENDLNNLKNPQNLPIKLILDSLIKFMEKHIQHFDCKELISPTIIQVVICVSNEMGCGKASIADILTLINYLTHREELIRLTCFEGLYILTSNVLPFIQDEYCRQKLCHRCFVGQFDKSDNCQAFSLEIFDLCNFETNSHMLDVILNDDIENINEVMTEPVSEAYKTLMEEYPAELENAYEKLIKLYQIKASSSIPSVDAFGRPLSKVHVDYFEPRLTIAYIFKNIVHLFQQKQVESFINFLIPEALSDNNESVRSAMLDAGNQLIDVHGKNNVNYLLNVSESFLDSAPDNHQTDLVRKSVIILMGTLAKHIEQDNPKLKPILSKLVETLSTPSQIVQEAVANCLQNLIPKFKEDAPALLQKLLEFLFESDAYGERKGAAYGIAGIVKGLGLLSINKMGIMNALTQAIQSKDKPNHREGALFAFEMLSHMLGRLFEPYIVHILPYLLDCFGDSSSRVRNAADDTAKVIMSKLTIYGCTLIYPAILKALEDDSWRKKTSSIDLLASMAYCAPKQLSQCLPKIVPKLMTVMGDSHPKVQRSAAQALKQIGSVIKNEEIKAIVPNLLNALQDPSNKTNECLNVMMKTKFVHVIDPPSLALIMPVIERAFQNRSTETRKMASQIVGNMYALAKSKDLSPYLSSIIPGLKNSLLDPVPEVRTATARALGAMVRSLGNELVSDLKPWMEKMIISEISSVDRSGAAQGLAEVLGGLGKEHLDEFMPKVLEVTEKVDVPSHVKDGYLMLYIYLPSVFTQHFSQYISKVINPILKALADENEFVRETALRAGQRIVNMYAETAIQLLLPELERGLFDENWRIRYSSVQLLGDLLFKITGLSGKMTTESGHEDDNFGTEQSHQALFEALGEERRNRVLSGLYMGRSDVSLQVRQASLHVWKVIVPNTPRTLKEILPVLFTLLLECLASDSSDRQQIGARTLGDLVRKLGERILPEIIPILEDGLKSNRADQRQGVCIGLSEIIVSTSKEMVQAYADNFIGTVRKALFDPLPEVRQAAARSFDHLHSALGEKALTDILTHLLNNIDHPKNGERVLDSLKNIISYKSKVILPNLIPKLTTKPVNMRALSFISSVAGESFSKYLYQIIPPLLLSLSETFGQPIHDEQLGYCQNVIISITDENGALAVILTLLDSSKSDDLNTKRCAVCLLSHYCIYSKPNLIANFRIQLLTSLIDLMATTDEYILNHCYEACNSVIKILDNQQQLDTVPDVCKKLKATLGDEYCQITNNNVSTKYFPGFENNKGIQPFLRLFKLSLSINALELRHWGVEGFRLIVLSASPEALKPSSMHITGSLLRILIDRLSTVVQITAIDTLSLILLKLNIFMKPFFPQLNTIFSRYLSTEEPIVNMQTAISIGRFSYVHPKPDYFITELLPLVKLNQRHPKGDAEAAYYSLRLSLAATGEKLSDSVHQQIYEFVCEEYDYFDIEIMKTNFAPIAGALCRYASPELLNRIAKKFLLSDDEKEGTAFRLYRGVALRIALKDAYDKIILQNERWSTMIHQIVLKYINSNKQPLIINGLKCAAYIIHNSLENNILPKKEFLQTFAKSMNHTSNDVKEAVTSSTIFWSQNKTDIPEQVLQIMVPHLVNGTKERNTAVRVNSEQALIALLKLKQHGENSDIYKKCLTVIGSGAMESLQDCVTKIKKNMSKIHFKDEEFDDTLASLKSVNGKNFELFV